MTLHSLRSQVGAAFEESFLFSDTIAANIAYGHPDATRAEVEEAARVAGAHDFILELADGYDTPVGERGLSLSGGQRQRIALARAILADPRILVLDDATSAVDSFTEEQIFGRLREVLAGRTSLIVAHRVSTLGLADRVVLLDRGRVADEGTHEELMGRNRAYRELLTGLDEEAAAAVGDSIETLTQIDVTPSAWQHGTGDRAEAVRDATERAAARIAARPSVGPGLGGGTWRLNLAPTPELLARVDALPPVRDRSNRTRSRTPGRTRTSRCGGWSPSSAGRSASASCSSSSTPWPGSPGRTWSASGSTTASRPTPATCSGWPPPRS